MPHSLILSPRGKVFTYGSNYKGQLSLGDQMQIHSCYREDINWNTEYRIC